MPVYLFQHTRESGTQDSNCTPQLTDHSSAFQKGPSASALATSPCARADDTTDTASVASGSTGKTAASLACESSPAPVASSELRSRFSVSSVRRAMLSSLP